MGNKQNVVQKDERIEKNVKWRDLEKAKRETITNYEIDDLPENRDSYISYEISSKIITIYLAATSGNLQHFFCNFYHF